MRSHESFDELGDVEYSAVVRGNLCVGRQEKVVAGATSCFWLAEVGSVAVYDEYHVTRAVGNDCIFMEDSQSVPLWSPVPLWYH